jgi:hypothetical protein
MRVIGRDGILRTRNGAGTGLPTRTGASQACDRRIPPGQMTPGRRARYRPRARLRALPLRFAIVGDDGETAAVALTAVPGEFLVT